MKKENQIYRYLLAIQEVRSAIKKNPNVSITSIAKENKVSTNLGTVLTRLGMIYNHGSKNRPNYTWTGEDMVFKDDVLEVIKTEYEIQLESKERRKAVKKKVSIQPGFDFEQYDKIILVKGESFTVLTPKASK